MEIVCVKNEEREEINNYTKGKQQEQHKTKTNEPSLSRKNNNSVSALDPMHDFGQWVPDND
jgi:hypothetical protein